MGLNNTYHIINECNFANADAAYLLANGFALMIARKERSNSANKSNTYEKMHMAGENCMA